MGLARSGNEYEAFCFDEAILTWGNYVTNEVEKIEAKNARATERKRIRKLEQLLSLNDTPQMQKSRSKKRQFADPADLFK